MSEKRIYFPVGKTPTLEQLNRFSWNQLQTRDLNDPKYAGFECNFDWHKYIQLNIKDPETLREVRKSLEQFSSTAEGQQTIRQGYAVQNYRIQIGNTGLPKDKPFKLLIDDIGPGSDGYGSANQFNPYFGAIHIDRAEIKKILVPSAIKNEKAFFKQSFQSVLYHELNHAKDALFGTYNRSLDGLIRPNDLGIIPAPIKHLLSAVEWFSPSKAAAMREAFHARQITHIFESPAIADTNHFMKKLYAEIPRALIHEGFLGTNIITEKAITIKSQPHLSGNHFYETMPHAPVTPNCQKPAARHPHR